MRVAIAVACVPVALALALAAARAPALPLSGDEPHYLIMADSLGHDLDLELRNNYLQDAETRRIVGPTIPHVYTVSRGWMPMHSAGFAVLLAVPFRLVGILGTRAVLCLFDGLLAVSLVVYFRRRLARADVSDDAAVGPAAWLTLGLTIALPTLFGAQRIYPDLAGGIVVTALLAQAIEMLDGKRQSVVQSTLFWLAAGLLPFVDARFTAAAILLACGGLAAAAFRRSHDRLEIRLVPALLFFVGPAALAAYNLWASQSPFGFQREAPIAAPAARTMEMLLALHLDQTQGMFVQQPLLLAGVAGLPILFAAREKGVRSVFPGMLWLATYAALVVPNALTLARYGDAGPAGRLGWSAAWLWAIPIGETLPVVHARFARWIPPAAVAGWAYQALLAARWLRQPAALFGAVGSGAAAAGQLFPSAMRRWLPSLTSWDASHWWTLAPNVVAIAALAALAVAGARLVSTPSRQ